LFVYTYYIEDIEKTHIESKTAFFQRRSQCVSINLKPIRLAWLLTINLQQQLKLSQNKVDKTFLLMYNRYGLR